MVCYVCNQFKGPANKWGLIYNYNSSFIGELPKEHIGSVGILVCPNCGALHTTLRGQIKDPLRKE